ncbi:MAG: hypothetical protein AAB921_04010, partial [Patescibacteria group bacterium]
MPDILTHPGTWTALAILFIFAVMGTGLYFITKDPCPGCGQRRHTVDNKKVVCMANLKNGGQWITFDVRVLKCRKPDCTAPAEESP